MRRLPLFLLSLLALCMALLVVPGSSQAFQWSTSHAVIDNATSYTFTGWAVPRGTNQLVAYGADGTGTGTNSFGAEAAIAGDCEVLSIVDGVGNMTVPSGGWVLSGHGNARTWMNSNIQVGDHVTGQPGTECSHVKASGTSSSRHVTGWNESRDTDELLVYSPAFGAETNTNSFGAELAVVNCVVTAKEYQVGDIAIPANGFVLSGHGTSKIWLNDNIDVGDTITQLGGTPCYGTGGGPTNQAPVVSAGPDQATTLPSGVTLDGSATDDGLVQPLFIEWTRILGPAGAGPVVFSSPNAADTTATFDTAGTYTLRISASDGELFDVDDVVITVNPAGGGGTNTAPTVSAGTDQTVPLSGGGSNIDAHGVKMIKPTIAGGMTWTSNWASSRSFGFGFDPQDPWLEGRGNGTYNVVGGELRVGGTTPRLYLQDPANVKQWRDIEFTTYFKRVSDNAPAYAGFTAVARSNHLPDSNTCDTRGIGARMRSDGHMDFEKETAHPNASPVANQTLYSGGLPFNVWIGFKYLVYDLANGNVRVELWRDTTDGANGGTWTLLNSFEDTGSNWGTGGTACASGINPGMRLTNSPSRAGSETGRPNPSVYFRSDNVNANGLVLKKASLREINHTGSFGGGGSAVANLNGTINDDGLPNPPAATTAAWTVVSGPGAVTFGNAGNEDTTATFTTAGTYVLRLTGSDSALTANDTVTITVT